MNDILEFIESGILESYVIGLATPQEIIEVEKKVKIHSLVRKEIDIIEKALEKYAFDNAIEPDDIIKSFLMATIDFSDRMKDGERPSFPPLLSQESKISDYSEWLNRQDMILPVDFNNVYAKIISSTPSITTAIVWIKNMVPQEVHHNEFERFLIVEGSCLLTIENIEHHLIPGCFMEIPLHKNHFSKITSEIPCKVILQRIAA